MFGMCIEPFQLVMRSRGYNPINAMLIRSDKVGQWSDLDIKSVQSGNFILLRDKINFVEHI
jgi:hypothetical protein